MCAQTFSHFFLSSNIGTHTLTALSMLAAESSEVPKHEFWNVQKSENFNKMEQWVVFILCSAKVKHLFHSRYAHVYLVKTLQHKFKACSVSI